MTLKPILLPTEDASWLLLSEGRLADYMSPRKASSGQNQHLYLVSDEPIKVGQYGYDKISNTILGKCDGFDNIVHGKCAHFKDGNLVALERILVIEFTTDPILIADGVGKIDGNTKAIIDTDITGVWSKTKVNFLEEFCKRHNQKDKGVDVEKLAMKILEDTTVIFEREPMTKYNEGKLNGIIEGLKHNQTLQSTGQYSLEDIHKAIEYGIFNPASTQKTRQDFIQSLQPKSKGDIVIDYNNGNLIFK